MFAVTNGATIKEFKLTNSYFYTNADRNASVVGYAVGGTIDTVYSNAIVKTNNIRVGGLVGWAEGITMKKSWFDGSVMSEKSAADTAIGGFIGRADKTVSIENCLNTGVVAAKTTGESGKAAHAGGFIGYVGNNSNITLKSSMNVGIVEIHNQSTYCYSTVAKLGSGSVLNTSLDAPVYATVESCSAGTGWPNNTHIIEVSKNDILGILGYQYSRLNLDFQNTWALVENQTPILQAFADKVIDVTKVEKVIDTSWYSVDATE